MHGQVVRAQMGDRAAYRPLESPLSPSSDAVDVVRALLSVYPFRTLYVADLDAIQRNGETVRTLRGIREEFPALQMWIDNGADSDSIEALVGAHLGTPVIGSESQRDSKLIAHHQARGESCCRSIFAAMTFKAHMASWRNPRFGRSRSS
jgi:phosphoribosylformimino-5-aminoimidazole carboxamide ribotide isomerase